MTLVIGPCRVTTLWSVSPFNNPPPNQNRAIGFKAGLCNIPFSALSWSSFTTNMCTLTRPSQHLLTSSCSLAKLRPMPDISYCGLLLQAIVKTFHSGDSDESKSLTDIWLHSCVAVKHGNRIGNVSTGPRLFAPTSTDWAASLTRGCIAEREEAHVICLGRRLRKDNALAKCWRSQRAWCAKKPRLTLHALTDEEERPLNDADDSGARLCSHWAQVFWGSCHRRLEPFLWDHSQLCTQSFWVPKKSLIF